ncbi:MAG: SLC13/DASS family transporter, partial [Bacteroidaceae bacterium]|nr:SLC13/DASS family transporter [Bacteroidaceae bacterium]
MFKNFFGYHLVANYHKKKDPKRYHLYGINKAFIASVIALVICLLPTECFGIAGFTYNEKIVVALFVWAAIMWITEAIPSWSTSVLIIVILLLTVSDKSLSFLAHPGIDGYGEPVSYKSILATFADPTIMLFIGGFVLALGMSKVKLDLHVARVLLKPFGTKSENVLLGFLLVTAVFSAFVSNTATAAMMLAFLTPVLKSLPADSKGRTALAMAIPVGANLGGIMTPIGTPPNTIALGYLNETLGANISFGEWTGKMTPFVLLLLIVAWFLLRWLFPFNQKQILLEIEGELEPGKQSYIVIAGFIVTIFLWCFSDPLNLGLNSYIIAMIPVALFACTGVLTRHDLEEINWSVLWMVAGGFALGLALNSTKLSDHLVGAIPFGEWSLMLVMIVAMLVCFLFSNFISNSATASLLVPVLGVVAGAMQDATSDASIPPRMLVAVAIAASVSMTLPISTP